MNEPKFFALVKRLIEKTRGSEIAWQETAGSTLKCRIDDYTIMITKSALHGIFADRPSRPAYQLDVLDEDGARVGHVPFGESDPLFLKAFEELYDAARRSAQGEPQAIDDLLRKLG